MNKKFIIAFAVLALAPAAFCQDIPASINIPDDQEGYVTDTLTTKKEAAKSGVITNVLEELNNPLSTKRVSVDLLPEAERNAVKQYHRQFNSYLAKWGSCNLENAMNTVRKASEEYPYFAKLNFSFLSSYDGDSSEFLITDMLDSYNYKCNISTENLVEVYSLAKVFYDDPAQASVLARTADTDQYLDATKYFIERPVCKKSCREEFLKRALLSGYPAAETIKTLISKTGAPAASFMTLFIKKNSLHEGDLAKLRALLKANPALLNARYEGLSLAAFMEKTRDWHTAEYGRTNLAGKALGGHKTSAATLNSMIEIVKGTKK